MTTTSAVWAGRREDTAQLTDTSGTTTRSSLTYGRDGAGQVASVASVGEPADNHTYGYTKLNQLKTVDSAALACDGADNLSRTRSGVFQAFDAANLGLLSVRKFVRDHDAQPVGAALLIGPLPVC